MVGRTAGREIAKRFNGDWAAFESALQSGFDFSSLPDFGPTMNQNLHAWYADPVAARLWRPALKHLIFQKEEFTPMQTNNPFFGKNVVATGKLEGYTRDGIQTRLLQLGAKPTSSVSKNTDYLIVGEKAGSKLAKARRSESRSSQNNNSRPCWPKGGFYMTNSNAIAAADNAFRNLAHYQNSSDALAELDGFPLSLDRIKIPSGGALVFQLPPDGINESEIVKSFDAVILYQHPVQVYYKDEYKGGNIRPIAPAATGLLAKAFRAAFAASAR